MGDDDPASPRFQPAAHDRRSTSVSSSRRSLARRSTTLRSPRHVAGHQHRPRDERVLRSRRPGAPSDLQIADPAVLPLQTAHHHGPRSTIAPHVLGYPPSTVTETSLPQRDGERAVRDKAEQMDATAPSGCLVPDRNIAKNRLPAHAPMAAGRSRPVWSKPAPDATRPFKPPAPRTA